MLYIRVGYYSIGQGIMTPRVFNLELTIREIFKAAYKFENFTIKNL